MPACWVQRWARQQQQRRQHGAKILLNTDYWFCQILRQQQLHPCMQHVCQEQDAFGSCVMCAVQAHVALAIAALTDPRATAAPGASSTRSDPGPNSDASTYVQELRNLRPWAIRAMVHVSDNRCFMKVPPSMLQMQPACARHNRWKPFQTLSRGS